MVDDNSQSMVDDNSQWFHGADTHRLIRADGGSGWSVARAAPSGSTPAETAFHPTDTPALFEAIRPRLRDELEAASEVLVCLDFDGTLAPIVDRPENATITADNERAIERLDAADSITTAVVSGRALSDVVARVDGPSIYAGNHGLELRRNGSETVHPIARHRMDLVAEACGLLEEVVEPIPSCRVEHKRLTGTVHVRGTPDPVRSLVARHVDDVVERIGDGALDVSSGKEIIEIAPAIPWGKGHAVELIEESHTDDAFVLYVGDDRTDESGFRAAETGIRRRPVASTRDDWAGTSKGIGIYVGDDTDDGGGSHASARLSSPGEVASVLEWLASVIE